MIFSEQLKLSFNFAKESNFFIAICVKSKISGLIWEGLESLENGSNDFNEIWYVPSFGHRLSFGGVVDPTKTHYDVIIGGQKRGQIFPVVQHRLMIHQSKEFLESHSNLFLYWCYDVITLRHSPLKFDFSLFLMLSGQYRSKIGLQYINRKDFFIRVQICFHIGVMTSLRDVIAP